MADTLNDLDMEFTKHVGGIITSNAEELAEIKKETGNQLYKAMRYQQAIPLYTEAIQLCPD
jgi:hypothetical protein